MGPVLIISPFNYPFKLVIDVLIAAVAAGCPVVIKPSELCPATALIIQKIVASALDPRVREDLAAASHAFCENSILRHSISLAPFWSLLSSATQSSLEGRKSSRNSWRRDGAKVCHSDLADHDIHDVPTVSVIGSSKVHSSILPFLFGWHYNSHSFLHRLGPCWQSDWSGLCKDSYPDLPRTGGEMPRHCRLGIRLTVSEMNRYNKGFLIPGSSLTHHMLTHRVVYVLVDWPPDELWCTNP